MPAYRYPFIAREGWIPIATFVATGLFAQDHLDAGIAAASWVTAALLLFHFRDPPRRVPPLPLGVISPTDGLVISIETVKDRRLEREMIRIRLVVRPPDVLSVRSPIEGRVMRQWFPDDVTREFAQWLQTDEHDDIVVAAARDLGRRAICRVHVGQRVGQGQRCGYLPFGARVDVLVPPESRVEVRPGEKVRSGGSVLARLVRR